MSPSDSLPTVICDLRGNLIMKRRISEEELFLVITRDRLSEMFEEAGANGLTFPEMTRNNSSSAILRFIMRFPFQSQITVGNESEGDIPRPPADIPDVQH